MTDCIIAAGVASELVGISNIEAAIRAPKAQTNFNISRLQSATWIDAM